jgi:hypothetical protein
MPISTTIDTPAALYALMTTTDTADLAQSYTQTANIDMSTYTSKSIAGTETTTPYDFSGIYDGQGYTITIGDVTDWTGLFGSIARPTPPAIGGIIKNINVIYKNALTITVSGINFNYTWGGLVGNLDVASIENCSVTFNNTLQVTATANEIPISLLCGFMAQNSMISNSKVIINNSISLIGNSNSSVSLLCGQATDSTITGCSVTSSSGSYNILLQGNNNISTPDSYCFIGLLCGYFGTNNTTLNQPVLTNNIVNLNNSGSVTLNSIGIADTIIGAICGILRGGSIAGPTKATNCIVNINNNQTLAGALTDFGQLVDNTTIQGCLFTWTTTT